MYDWFLLCTITTTPFAIGLLLYYFIWRELSDINKWSNLTYIQIKYHNEMFKAECEFWRDVYQVRLHTEVVNDRLKRTLKNWPDLPPESASSQPETSPGETRLDDSPT